MRNASELATMNGTQALVSFDGRMPTLRIMSKAVPRVGSVQCWKRMNGGFPATPSQAPRSS